MKSLPLSYSDVERQRRDAEAQALLGAHPRVVDLIARGATRAPGGEALVYIRSVDDPAPPTFSYPDWLGLIAAAARWLKAAGCGPQDGVALFAPACPAMAAAMWAATAVGVAMPLNLLFSREAVAAQLTAGRVKFLFVPPPGAPGGLFEKAAGLDREVESLERIVVLPLDGQVAFDGESLRPDPDGLAGFGPVADGEADRIAAMLPTGGTTGHPKIVCLTQRNMVASALGSMLAGGYGPGDRVTLGTPPFHVGGAFVAMLAGFGGGAAVCIPTAMGMRNPEIVARFWDFAAKHRITHAGMTPTSLAAVAANPAKDADLSRLRLCMTGAASCPPEIERRFLEAWGRGDAVRQIYGMTEFAGAIAQVAHDRAPDGGAVGLPVALAEVAVLADGIIHRGPSPRGELLARGPQVFPGYCDPRQTPAAFHEGWLRTGDLCEVLPSGQILIVGRLKDLIIRGGHNIDPVMIEDAALQFPGVAMAAAVGLPDAYAGETPMLFVTPEKGVALDAEALAGFMAERVAEAPARPKAIAVLDEIPVTPVGKVFKPRLRELAAEEAVRRLAADIPGIALVEVSAAHVPVEGLVVRLIASGDPAAVERLRDRLALLPIKAELTASDPA